MQPSIAAENTVTRQRIIMKYYIPRVFVKHVNKKCRSVVNEQKFGKLSVSVLPVGYMSRT